MKATEQHFPVVLFIMLYKVLFCFPNFLKWKIKPDNFSYFVHWRSQVKVVTFSTSSPGCPVHSDILTHMKSSKHGADWRKNEEPRFADNQTATKGFNSTVFAPPNRYAHYRTPNFFTSDECQIAHVRREKKVSQRDQYGQRVPVSSRRAVVIQKADDAPDPFCILTREK